MGWGFRKSTTAGGVRFTFSKSGISTSVGGKGLRFTSGPRGVYVTTGFGGFYYRQRIGGARPPASVPQPPPRDEAAPHYYATETFGSAGVEHLTDVSQDEFVSSLDEWTTRGALQVITGVGVAVALSIALAMGASERILAEVTAYGLIAFLLTRFIENRRRRFLLIYDLGAAEAKRYQQLSEALAELSASGRFRGVKMIGHHYDWKRNAGATRALSFESASLRRSAPPHIVTNIGPWTLSVQGMKLYFFPDRILIRSRGRFAALSYQALSVEIDTSNFVWDESLPGDAQVVGHTWLYVRRDGGPDRRFNGNRQIPLVRTAYLTLKSSTGLEAVVQTTKVGAAERWERAVRTYARETSHAARAIAAVDPELRHALSTLGLVVMPSAAELKKAYRELAQRNHPDKFAHDPRDIRIFAEQRMREINDDYELLAGKLASQPASEMPSAGYSVAPAPSEPQPAWRSADAGAALFAVLAISGVFTGFRVTSENTTEFTPTPQITSPVMTTTPPSAPVEAPKRRLVIACPLRAEPSPKGKQLALIPKGTELEMLESRDRWWYVRDEVGKEGWTGPKCWQPALPRSRTIPGTRGAASEAATTTTRSPGAPVDPYTEDPATPESKATLQGSGSASETATTATTGAGAPVDPYTGTSATPEPRGTLVDPFEPEDGGMAAPIGERR